MSVTEKDHQAYVTSLDSAWQKELEEFFEDDPALLKELPSELAELIFTRTYLAMGTRGPCPLTKKQKTAAEKETEKAMKGLQQALKTLGRFKVERPMQTGVTDLCQEAGDLFGEFARFQEMVSHAEHFNELITMRNSRSGKRTVGSQLKATNAYLRDWLGATFVEYGEDVKRHRGSRFYRTAKLMLDRYECVKIDRYDFVRKVQLS
jgi:hypothetical protein